MAGLDTTKKGNELSQPKSEFTRLDNKGNFAALNCSDRVCENRFDDIRDPTEFTQFTLGRGEAPHYVFMT